MNRCSSNLRTYLNATLVDIELDAGHNFISSLIFRSYDVEAPFVVRARYVVLCFGGIENARFLLNANRQVSAGLGNQNDLVGRFFCEHPVFHVGSAVLRHVSRDGPFSQYIPSRDLMLRERCTNFLLTITGLHEGTFMRWAREAVCHMEFSRELINRVLGRTIQCFDIDILLGFEQALNPDSRVLLGKKTDRFGQRRADLDWRFSDLDFHTMRTAITEVGKRLAVTDMGRARMVDWLQADKPRPPGIDTDVVGSIHHMCTTRMSDNPREGVVDRDCRIHGIQNLYIGGSSVFATASYAHPTFTIVQLALRLADHLDSRLRS